MKVSSTEFHGLPTWEQLHLYDLLIQKLCDRQTTVKHVTAINKSTFYSLHQSYVYWTVHHLDSWIKKDLLDVTCFIISLFNAQHVSDVNTSIVWSLRLICWVMWYPFAGWGWGCIALVRCVLVLRCGLAVVVWYPYAGTSASACIRIPHHHSQTTT